MREIETDAVRCPVCSSADIVSLGPAFTVPILMNRLNTTRDQARSAPTGDVRLARCASCGFTCNRAFRPDLIVYDSDYENEQSLSQVFTDHLASRVADVVGAARRLIYLEVGCGQGSFLARVVTVAGDRLIAAEGFDPAWRGADGDGPFGARIHKRYFTRESAALLAAPPNVVATRHTIEHVPDPLSFLRAIRTALGNAAQATIFVETPCVDWIFRHDAMQDFFYEHCSIFTARALATALERAGFYAPTVEHVFGGQYLWARARTTPDGAARTTPAPLDARDVSRRRDEFVARWRRIATDASREGLCAIWGAGAKGVNFALMTAKTASSPFDHVVDINPAKQGRRVAGSGLEALSPEQSVARGVATYFVMNPNYRDEIAARLTALGSKAELIVVDGEARK